MKIFTVSSRDTTDLSDRDDFFVEGAYTTKALAVEKAVEYVFNRIDFRLGFAQAMANDENHPEAKSFFSVRRSDKATVVRKGCVAKLKEYLRREFDCLNAYDISSGSERYRFDIDETRLGGELWLSVTWGDSDTEDPAFTTPRAEAFATKEAAVASFLGWAENLFREYGMRYDKAAEAEIRRAVDEDGRAHVDINDGCCISLVLQRDDTADIKE